MGVVAICESNNQSHGWRGVLQACNQSGTFLSPRFVLHDEMTRRKNMPKKDADKPFFTNVLGATFSQTCRWMMTSLCYIISMVVFRLFILHQVFILSTRHLNRDIICSSISEKKFKIVKSGHNIYVKHSTFLICA